MAKIKLVHVWPDGATTTITVHAATSYPDALAEAKRTALDMFVEAAVLLGINDE